MGSEGQHTQKRAGLGLSSEFTFPLVVGRRRASDQLRNCATGTLDRSPLAIRSAQIRAVFEDGKRDLSRISLRTGDRNKERTLNLPASGPCVEKNPIRPVCDYDQFIGCCGDFLIDQLKPVRSKVILSLRVYVPGLFASRSESLEEWLSARSFSEIDRIGSLHFNPGLHGRPSADSCRFNNPPMFPWT